MSMDRVIKLIKAGEIEEAIAATKNLQSGIDWNYGGEDDDPDDPVHSEL